MFIVISHDIKDDKRRNKVCNELKNYGEHVQYSVFECDLSRIQMEKLQADLSNLINKRQDNIRCYFLCQKCLDKIVVRGKSTFS